MYTDMRRKKNEQDEAAAFQYLQAAPWGVLSLAAEGLPYGVPMSHALEGRTLYLHCALQGQKMDFIRKNPVGCYTAVSYAETLPKKGSVAYESVMAFGPLRVAEDEAERLVAFRAINRQHGVSDADGERFIQKWGKGALILALDIERITAKSTRKVE